MIVWILLGVMLIVAVPVAAAGVDQSFFKDCAFVSVDLQEIPRTRMTEMPLTYKQQGFTLEDINAATDYLFDVATPNAVKVADACRAASCL